MKRIPIVDGKTKCHTCKEVKALGEFGVNKARWNGIQGECNECRKKRRKETYAKAISNSEAREKLKAAKRSWNRENPEKAQSYCRNHYRNNREYHIQRVKNWRAANRERHNEGCRRRRKVNPQRFRESGRRNYQRHKDNYRLLSNINEARRLHGAEGKCSLEDWLAIVNAQEGKCNICGRGDLPLTLDHIVPASRGGSNWPDNIQGLCLKCNLKKHTKTMDEYMQLSQRAS